MFPFSVSFPSAMEQFQWSSCVVLVCDGMAGCTYCIVWCVLLSTALPLHTLSCWLRCGVHCQSCMPLHSHVLVYSAVKYMYSTCVVHVIICMVHICIVHIQYTFSASIVHVECMYSIHMYSTCMVHIYMYSACIVHVEYM